MLIAEASLRFLWQKKCQPTSGLLRSLATKTVVNTGLGQGKLSTGNLAISISVWSYHPSFGNFRSFITIHKYCRITAAQPQGTQNRRYCFKQRN
ncbi:hypothetical protein L873DRAFT_270836 [Choiromyces venosus 120613-1]|uniref:Uncharacterized protein n=1 Tax=Choiromyces venosus 120613-1 TaxID=1336337 RepID=A0A3N4J0P3_9PEZI|nr:hypothetical protein L873DRAFT_270836 [Choiromyces venosus 120613-1]